MVSQILNFGLPAPIDVQMAGLQGGPESRAGQRVDAADRPHPRHHRPAHPAALQPAQVEVNVDRTRAQEVGYSQRDVAQGVLTSLSGSFQTAPTFYLNPQNHVSYNIAVQTPQYEVKNLQELQNFPIATKAPPSSRRSSATSHRLSAASSRER